MKEGSSSGCSGFYCDWNARERDKSRGSLIFAKEKGILLYN